MTGMHKLSDAIRQLWRKASGGKGGELVAIRGIAAEQIRQV